MTKRRDYYLGPAADEDTKQVLDTAIAALAAARNMGRGDAGVDLHLLMSLIEEAKTRVGAAVTEARSQQYSWAQVADLLGVTRASAWQRYSRGEEAEAAE